MIKSSALRRIFACAIVLLADIALGGLAFAAEVAYEASLAAGHSDNIRRTTENEQEEDIAAAGLRFSVDHISPRIEGRAVGDVAYHEYLDNTFESDFLGNFAGDARFAFVPDRLEWVVADNFGQVLSDPFVPATPDNRENINYFTTGPDLMLGLGSQNRLRLGARYSLISYEDSDFDSDATSAELGFIRALSAASAISVNGRVQQIEYDESALDADYDQSEAYARYEANGIRTNLALDVGYTEIDREATPDSEGGLLLRLEASRRLSGSSTAMLNAGREFSNSGTAFADAQVGGGIGLGAVPGQQTALPFTHEYVTIGWQFSRNRTGLGLSASWSDQSSEDLGSTELDQTLSSLNAYYSRQLSARTSMRFDVLYTEGEFSEGDLNQDSDYDELNGSLSFNWQLSRSLSLAAVYDHYKRSSDLTAGDAKENRFWLSIAFGSGRPRRQYAPPEFAIDERT
jgi:hypothetical protein